MRKLEIKLQTGSYPIHIEQGLFQKAGEWIQQFFPGKKAIIITDTHIAPLYGNALVNQLQACKTEAVLYAFAAGESSKNHEELMKLYTVFEKHHISRSDVIIALGGGVTGDLAGYAAATWLRGTGFIQIPTSLLAMVDSSIGGKVAVNLPMGKNMVGSFYHPEGVLIDPLLLKTLSHRHFADGMAEVVKYGCISDESLFLMLEGLKTRDSVMENIEEIVYRCCSIKRKVVEADERDKGIRMILNFGHTFGHVIEKVFEYKRYTHGEAVSMGMVFSAELSNMLGLCDENLPGRIEVLLKQFKLPVEFPKMDQKAVLDTVLMDKKAGTHDIRLILISNIGKVHIETISKDRAGGLIDEKYNH